MFLWLGLLLVEGIVVLALPLASECDDGVGVSFANQTNSKVSVFNGSKQIMTLEPMQRLSVAFICVSTANLSARSLPGEKQIMSRTIDCQELIEMYKRKEAIMIHDLTPDDRGAQD